VLRSILVVDDEPGMRAALSEALTRSGYSVLTATDGIEALEKVKRGAFDLVITDVRMPQMNGLEVLREVRRVSPKTHVVMITAYGTVPSAVEAMKEGAFDYLLKPFSCEDVEGVVGRAFSDRKNYELNEIAPNGGSNSKRIVTEDPQMFKILELARSVASSKATVLVQGESGTGKELLAYYIYQNSARREKPFVAVNCAALPEGLLESELFGHEKGSFTGAVGRRIGKFELANHGTLLLDEISQMAPQLQAKLLRALQENEVDRIGGKSPIPIDIRILATTNVDLRKAVNENKFREDLYYRLNVIPITLPPLRERKKDIPLLTRHFVEKHNLKNGKRVSKVSEEAMPLLMENQWKGNVRELENIIERAVLLCEGDVIRRDYLFLDERDISETPQTQLKAGLTMKEMEKELIFKTLEGVGGNRTHAAKVLGISIRTLRNKLKEYRSQDTNVRDLQDQNI
jgi:DNA-binding NtrC family response regulator